MDKDILDNEMWDKVMEPFSPEGEDSGDDNNEGSQPGEDNMEEGVEPIAKTEISLPSKEEIIVQRANHNLVAAILRSAEPYKGTS